MTNLRYGIGKMYDYQKVKRHTNMQILIAGIVILLSDSIRQKTLLEMIFNNDKNFTQQEEVAILNL